MKKNLYLSILINSICFVSIIAMEEREKPIDPKTLAEISKLPKEAGQAIQQVAAFEGLPADLLLPILVKFAAGNTLEESLNAMKQFRLISHRFDNLIKDKSFIKSMVNYWSEKYKVPRAYIPVAWSLTLKDIPAELIKQILSYLVEGESHHEVFDNLTKLRFINKNFNQMINSIDFVTEIIDYLHEKFSKPKAVLAVAWGIPGAVEWLKLQDKETINEIDRTGDFTALMLAAQKGRLDLVKVLVERGANINYATNVSTPLTIAISWGARRENFEIAKFLIEQGANVNYSLKEYGQTPIYDAIRSKNEELVGMLIAKGAKLDHRDKMDWNPLSYAISDRMYLDEEGRKKLDKIIQRLREAGAPQ